MSAFSDDSKFLVSCASRVIAAGSAIPRHADLTKEHEMISAAVERGWFNPDEDEAVHDRYAAYLASREALLEEIESLRKHTGDSPRGWEEMLSVFAVAFAAACLCVRGSHYLIRLGLAHPLLWKKLDEAEKRYGLPRKTFTHLHRTATAPARLNTFRKAVRFYHDHREKIHALRNVEGLAGIVEVLEDADNVAAMDHATIWKRRIHYRWFSFIRRHISGYRKTMFHLFRWSGSAIAEMKQPFIKPRGAEKRIRAEQRAELLDLLRAGDVIITRHDDAMSNLFLPGYWPHAALFLGGDGAYNILEAKKDGVKFRHSDETFGVDSLLVFRSPLGEDSVRQALARAVTHEGKLYDFLFDFCTADRLSCTEVIYRTFHGFDGISFSLLHKSARYCLPAEALIDQMLAQGFGLVATCNIVDGKISTGEDAMREFLSTRGS